MNKNTTTSRVSPLTNKAKSSYASVIIGASYHVAERVWWHSLGRPRGGPSTTIHPGISMIGKSTGNENTDNATGTNVLSYNRANNVKKLLVNDLKTYIENTYSSVTSNFIIKIGSTIEGDESTGKPGDAADKAQNAGFDEIEFGFEWKEKSSYQRKTTTNLEITDYKVISQGGLWAVVDYLINPSSIAINNFSRYCS